MANSIAGTNKSAVMKALGVGMPDVPVNMVYKSSPQASSADPTGTRTISIIQQGGGEDNNSWDTYTYTVDNGWVLSESVADVSMDALNEFLDTLPDYGFYIEQDPTQLSSLTTWLQAQL